ncbi:VRR-NUC domain-containing protein [Microbulbifer bruguierae]|uniref:phosphodiesterase I n=1 Tax=Microbulbifer bruguierae TaxID=3029061 RepID=A0ABY8NCR0_9GAMM|nr:VRR-NUC domain-containing protein [Microbulbifer bruguierae]WGL15213.1 VRR-NUC domain-containing protein [Microbulbifer bruguierae]
MTSVVELPANYYLNNFLSLMEFVTERYAALLSQEERQFCARFHRLDKDSQQLYVRLLSRKGVPSPAGALFRQSKLVYVEISDLPAAAAQLVQAGLLQRNPVLSVEALLPLFTKAELLASSQTPLAKTLKRPALEQALLAQAGEAVADRLLSGESLLAVQAAECFETFKLCFFGNLNQDLTDYVLRDLGLLRYERYPLERERLPFQHRAQIEQHLHYYQCLAEAETAMQSGSDAIQQLAAKLPQANGEDATLARRVDRLRLHLARQLERLDALDAAEQLYGQCTRPPARERRARIAVQRGDTGSGLALCREIMATPWDEAEQEFAEGFGYRTAKATIHRTDWPAPEKYRPPTETVSLQPGPECVELQAASHLAQSSATGDDMQPPAQCFYVENTLFNGVLGLYVWDIVFAPIPGAFFNPFQIAPSDFRTGDFYRQRRTAFEQRLSELDRQSLQQRVWENYRNKSGIANPLVTWEALPKTLLEMALERISPQHWQQIFRRLLADIGNHRSGLPDLILFPADGSYELVEVKGPGDRLQQNQQRWLRFFARHQIPHRVVHVEWQP